jgi:hypothetical protein
MVAIRLDQFGGMQPAVDDRLLPNTAAAFSRDTYLYSGGLIGWRTPKHLYTLVNPTTRSTFRIPVDDAKTAIDDPSVWVEFDDVDTTILKSPVVDDSYRRFYFASPSLPPKYNNWDRLSAGQAAINTTNHHWLLGIPAPVDAPIITPYGGTDDAIAQVRSYVYTFVSGFGEEGPPSPPTVANGYSNDWWDITVGAADPGDVFPWVNRFIFSKRIYRTVTSTSGVATYFLVAEIGWNVTTWTDAADDSTIALNPQLESDGWIGPPTDLEGMVAAPNGMFVGWRKNEIWFCEPFRPHAWPAAYALTTEYPIVACAVAGQSIVVVTKGYPAIIQGVHPAAVTMTHVRIPEPCASKGSVVSSMQGVYYMSPNGLISVTPYGQVANLTENFVSGEKWALYTPPYGVRALSWGGFYWAFGSVFKDPVTSVETSVYARAGFTIDFGHSQPDTKFSTITAPASLDITDVPLVNPDIYDFFVDFYTSIPLLIQGDSVFQYDFLDQSPKLMPYLWRSKIFQTPDKKNLSAMRVFFSVPPNTTGQNSTRDISPTQPTLGGDRYGIIRVYADGVLRTTREIRTSGELLRIFSGQLYDFWQFEIEARVNISNVQVASTVKELSGV